MNKLGGNQVTPIASVRVNELVKFSGYESGAFIGRLEAAREVLGKDIIWLTGVRVSDNVGD